MKYIISILIGFFATMVSLPAHALFDARLTYGFLGSRPDLSPLFGLTTGLPDVTPTYGLGADVLIMPPLFPIGFGLRYESMGLDVKSGNNEYKTDYTRTALLINYRFIDTLLFLGPIASYGLSHSGTMKIYKFGAETSNFSSDKMSSYSIGLEAGVKLVGLRLGAELGYENFQWKDSKDSHGAVSNQNIDMSGTYAKVLLGFGI
jgi:hypothetical protein